MAGYSMNPITISDDSDDASAGGSGRSVPNASQARKKSIARVDNVGIHDDTDVDMDDKEMVLDTIKASERLGKEMGPVGGDLDANGVEVNHVMSHNSDTVDKPAQPDRESTTVDDNTGTGIISENGLEDSGSIISSKERSFSIETDYEDVITPFLKLEAEYEKRKDAGSASNTQRVEFEAERKTFYEALIKKEKEETLNKEEKSIVESRKIKPLPKNEIRNKNYKHSFKAFADRQKDHPIIRKSTLSSSKKPPLSGLKTAAASPNGKKRKLTEANFGQKKKTNQVPAAPPNKMAKVTIREEDYIGDTVRKDGGVTSKDVRVSTTRHEKKKTLIVKLKTPSLRADAPNLAATIAARATATSAPSARPSPLAPKQTLKPKIPSLPMAARATATPAQLARPSPFAPKQTTLSGFVINKTPLDPDQMRLVADHIEPTRSAKGDQKEIDRNIKYFTAYRRPKPVEGTSGSESLYTVKGVRTPLKAYQINGIGFMRKREAHRPADSKEPSGGIVADEMGLGKTIMAIVNFLDGRPSKKDQKTMRQTTLIVCPPTLIEHWKQEIDKHVELEVKWTEYKSSMSKSTNSASSLFGNVDIVFASYTAVQESCPPLGNLPNGLDEEAREAWYKNWFDKKGGLLHKFHFERVYLDEAQHIKNEASLTSLACRCLNAEHRWMLTGTPLTDKIIELYAFFKMLRVPWTGYLKEFRQNYCNPQDKMHLQRLQFIIRTYMLRRTHHDQLFGKKLLDLPEATQTTIWLDLDGPELVVYTEIMRFFIELAKDSDDTTISLRLNELLRQTLSHPLNIQRAFALLPKERIERIEKAYMKFVPKTEGFPNNILNLHEQIFGETKDAGLPHGGKFGQNLSIQRYLRLLEKSIQEERTEKVDTVCSSCRHIPAAGSTPVVNSCGHVFCTKCVSSLQFRAAKAHKAAYCPEEGCDIVMNSLLNLASKKDLEPKLKKLFEAAGSKEKESKWIDLKMDGILSSKKTLAAKVVILDWINKDPDCKIIIFTIYRDTQNIMKKVCEIEGWAYRKINGDTTFSNRTKYIEEFGADPDIRVLLASVQVGGVGLNLTAANRVLLMEPWWNDATEQQAFSRVCRIGQRSTTGLEFIRLRYRGTVDEKIFGMQEFKTLRNNQVIERNNQQPVKTSQALELFTPHRRTDGGVPFIYLDDTIIPARWINYKGPESGDECEGTPNTSDEESMRGERK